MTVVHDSTHRVNSTHLVHLDGCRPASRSSTPRVVSEGDTRVGRVMSIHKVASGNGYTYLTRQVAANDVSARGSGSLASYYAEKGESPGVWLSSGITAATWNETVHGMGGVSDLHLGDLVTEAQIVALFGEGRHPNADAIEAALSQAGVRGRMLERATMLGQKFRSHTETNVFRDRLADTYRSHNVALGFPSGASIGGADRARLRTVLASTMFTERYGRAPSDGRELSGFLARVSRPAAAAVAGYDLTFSPVKSVSALWAVAPIEVAEVIASAHQEAVRDAISWLERNAAFTRTGADGVAQVVETRGFLAAAFTHRDSRAGDPDLHTHAAVINKVQALDGRWLALDGRALYSNKVAASERYNTRLEALLVQRLGVGFADRPGPAERRPVREIVGVWGPLTDAWSKRRHAITAETDRLAAPFEADHGRSPSPAESRELAQVATLSTREGKHEPRSHAEQRAAWREQAVGVLGSEHAVTEFVNASMGPLTLPPDRSPAPTGQDVERAAGRVLAVVSGQRASWQPHHVRAEAERHARTIGIGLEHLDAYVSAVVTTALGSEHSISLNPPRPISEPQVLRRSDGTSVYEVAGSRRYTSTAILAAERAVLDLAARADGHTISLGHVGLALIESEANGVRLGADQRALVRALATSGARVQLALAPAGTGKTVALRTLARAWTAAGGTVVGLAPSAAAAAVLGQELKGTRSRPTPSRSSSTPPAPAPPSPTGPPASTRGRLSCWTRPGWPAPLTSPSSASSPPSAVRPSASSVMIGSSPPSAPAACCGISAAPTGPSPSPNPQVHPRGWHPEPGRSSSGARAACGGPGRDRVLHRPRADPPRHEQDRPRRGLHGLGSRPRPRQGRGAARTDPRTRRDAQRSGPNRPTNHHSPGRVRPRCCSRMGPGRVAGTRSSPAATIGPWCLACVFRAPSGMGR